MSSPPSFFVPGRICLLGEHCDWGGGHSLVVPLVQGITVQASPRPANLTVRSEWEAGTLEAEWQWGPGEHPAWKDSDPLRFVLAVAVEWESRGVRVPPLHLAISTSLPAGRGFSSSAALSVGVARALFAASRPASALSWEEAAEVAWKSERHRLGIQCGRLDPYACAASRPLAFSWKVEEFQAVPTPIGRDLALLAGFFTAPRDTPLLLRTIQSAFFSLPGDPAGEGVRQVLATWSRLADEGAAALAAGDWGALGGAMNRAQAVYDQVLSPLLPPFRAPSLAEVCGFLRREGALGAKFSGAGGEGSVVALLDDEVRADALISRLASMGVTAFRVVVPSS